MNRDLAAALAKFNNSPTALAKALEGIGASVSRQNIEHWIKVGHVPPAHSPFFERVSCGAATCEGLSEEGTVWARIPDRSWPWHKRGRPVLDVSKVAA